MNLTRLVYYSQRNPSESLEIEKLIETCKRNNGRMNVSGLLHYNGDPFLQVLEGGGVSRFRRSTTGSPATRGTTTSS
jgi:hypothetical protein